MRRIILIDMDETLGTFTEIGTFLTALLDLCPRLDYNTEFFKAMNLFTGFHRPRIVQILKHMTILRTSENVSKIVLYTNNQGSNEWVRLIASYFDTQVGCRVFDDIIFSYMINGNINDHRRTTHDKVLCDVYNCINIYSPTKFLFIDDQLHNGMVHKDVTYLRVEPYVYYMEYSRMATLYHNTYVLDDMNQEEFVTAIVFLMSRYGYVNISNNRPHSKYVRLSNKIMNQLISFSR